MYLNWINTLACFFNVKSDVSLDLFHLHAVNMQRIYKGLSTKMYQLKRNSTDDGINI